MGITTYVMIVFGLSLALFMLGSTPPMFAQIGCSTEQGVTCNPNQNMGIEFLNAIYNAILQNPLVSITGIAFLVTGAFLGGSFVVIYIVPIVILTVALNFFVLPTSFFFNESLPPMVGIVFLSFLNLFLILTIITFVRGGD